MEKHVGILDSTLRTTRGKGAARKLRAKGLIPAVVYGEKGESVSITVDPLHLGAALDSVKRYNTMIELTIKSEDGKVSDTQPVLVKEHDIDCLRLNLTHVDFIRVNPAKPVHVEVPLELTGRSIGVQLGGMLNQVFRELPVSCAPGIIPGVISADVTELQIGGLLRVSDLAIPEGVQIKLPAEQTVALVVAGRGASETTETAEGDEDAAAAGEQAPAA